MSPAIFVLTLAFAEPSSVTVAKDGSANFVTVQAAVDSLPEGGVIRIRAGLYEEKVTISASNIQLRGLGSSPKDVVLSWNLNATAAGGTFKSASTTVTGDDFYAENLTFENTYSRTHPLQEGSQAVALRITGDRAVFRKVRFLGHQDTLYATTAGCMSDEPGCKPARQYFADCYVEGNVDYIFGDAVALFDNCEIHSLPNKMIAITAQSRHRAAQDSGYVFYKCRLTAEDSVENVYLGRPWRAYAKVIFIDTYMGAEIAPAGWLEWEHDGKPSLPTTFLSDYRSRGPGAVKGRERNSRAVTLSVREAAEYQPKVFLKGDDNWDPTKVK